MSYVANSLDKLFNCKIKYCIQNQSKYHDVKTIWETFQWLMHNHILYDPSTHSKNNFKFNQDLQNQYKELSWLCISFAQISQLLVFYHICACYGLNMF